MTGGAADRWRPAFGPLALLLGFIGGNLVGAIVVAGVPGGVSNGTASPAAVDIGTVILDLAFVTAAVLFARRAGRLRPGDFGLAGSPFLRTLGVLALAVVAFIVVTTVWFAAVNSSGQEHQLVKDVGGYGGTLNVIVACAVTCVVAPICEEFLFRGFVYRSLRNWHGIWPAALITGLLFGAVHGLSAPPSTSCRSHSSASSSASSTRRPGRSTPASRCTSSTTRSRSAPTSTGTGGRSSWRSPRSRRSRWCSRACG